MKQKIDLKTWNRRDHFYFFKDFEDPLWGVTVNVDCTKAYIYAKENNISFFLLYLYKSLKAAIDIEAFKYRIVDDDVVCYDVLMASPTIDRKDGTFGFSYIEYHEDFNIFIEKAKEVIKKVQDEKGLIPATHNENVIHYSTVPWVQFTAVEYPRNNPKHDSIPKITFGKVYTENDKLKMPVSLLVHHALIDGYHIGKHIDLFQKYLDEG